MGPSPPDIVLAFKEKIGGGLVVENRYASEHYESKNVSLVKEA